MKNEVMKEPYSLFIVIATSEILFESSEKLKRFKINIAWLLSEDFNPLKKFYSGGIPKLYFQANLSLASDLSVAFWLARSAILLVSIWKPLSADAHRGKSPIVVHREKKEISNNYLASDQ